MRRRVALLTCILVLTFSLSGWRNVCDGMSEQASTQTMPHPAPGGHEHDTGSPSHSHQTPGDTNPVGHCQSASSCPGVSLVAEESDVSIDAVHSDRVQLVVQLAPASQSPDLEPPPPKA